MFDNDFGTNLSLEEKNFMNEYCNLTSQYGSSSFFPMSNESKMEQYSKLLEIINKLSPEEITKFNEFIDKAQSLHLGDGLENKGRAK